MRRALKRDSKRRTGTNPVSSATSFAIAAHVSAICVNTLGATSAAGKLRFGPKNRAFDLLQLGVEIIIALPVELRLNA